MKIATEKVLFPPQIPLSVFALFQRMKNWASRVGHMRFNKYLFCNRTTKREYFQMSSTSKITSFFIRCPNLDILHRWFNAGQSSKSSKAVIQFGQSLHTSISTLDDRSDTMMLRIRNTFARKDRQNNVSSKQQHPRDTVRKDKYLADLPAFNRLLVVRQCEVWCLWSARVRSCDKTRQLLQSYQRCDSLAQAIQWDEKRLGF